MAGVEQELAEGGVMPGVEPTCGAVLERHGPVDGGVSAVGSRREARQAGVVGWDFGFHAGNETAPPFRYESEKGALVEVAERRSRFGIGNG